MKGHKGQPYQGGTRVPAFFRWPGGGIKGDSESAALTSQMDIMPTLLEIAGTPLTDQIKQQVEGRSLVPLLKNPAADWEDRYLVHHAGGWEPGQAAQSKHARVSIQNKRFTLVNNEELYDLKTDPDELTNLYGKTEHAATIADVKKQLDAFVGDLASGKLQLFKGPLAYQDGTAFLADGKVGEDRDIWYMKQLLQGMEGQSSAK